MRLHHCFDDDNGIYDDIQLDDKDDVDNRNYDDKGDDDNLVLQGPDGRGYITQPFSGPSYSPGRSGLALSS